MEPQNTQSNSVKSRAHNQQSTSTDSIGQFSHNSSIDTNKSQEDDLKEKAHPQGEQWRMASEVEDFRNAMQSGQQQPRQLGITWNALTVRGVGSDSTYNENLFSQFNIPNKIRESRQPKPLKTILDNSQGCVKPGKMLLVLGRPGAGCTTLLKMLANRRLGYAEVDGEVHFGSMDAQEAKQYRGQIVMNTEEEIFFPSGTVGEVMDFATRMKVPYTLPPDVKSAEEFRQRQKDFLLRSMGIEHTADTKVGNEYVRGVSGGERKRVSIIETMATRGSVFCWDNSTRGLDSNTSLEFVRALRTMTDVMGLATVVSLYQAGNGIYNLFDDVLVLEQGKQIFYGPVPQAKPFMEELGFVYTEGANIADFLVSVTVPTERKVKGPNFPRSAEEIKAAYENSDIYREMQGGLDYHTTEEARRLTVDFKAAVAMEKHKWLPTSSVLTAALTTQIQANIRRQFQLILHDKPTLIIRMSFSIIQALVAGSLFYNAPENSAGLFSKSGALFFALLYPALLALSEVTDSFTARPVLAKHRAFALHHPVAFCVAQIVVDIPILFVELVIFLLPVYFMTGLRNTAGAFFTFWIVVFASTMAMTSLMRAIGAAFPTFDAASKVSGLGFSVAVTYVGYLIPRTEMVRPLFWLSYINPLAYGFEALLGNELPPSTVLPCVGPNLVPSGPGYVDTAFQACTGVSGALKGAATVTGPEYLGALSYSSSNIWRNFGILWVWWIFYVALTMFFTSRWSQVSGNSGFLVIPREKAAKYHRRIQDVESQSEKSANYVSSEGKYDKPDDVSEKSTESLMHNTSVFTWKNLTYTVKTPSGDRVLLDKISGLVKPGQLGALMGSSGAGKTTLLDVLAQRKTEGTIKGSILVDGKELGVSFQRNAGYVEQLDVHEPLATVREALEFSALLRQAADVPREEKLKYVDTIIDLLEMRDIENTLVGTTYAGLSVEQRKRLTIGVELVSKPSILIFLDEPTSGLDATAAYNILRFLKRLAAAGQAILVTIHQPSGSLFAEFDTLLLLAKGGKTVYNGDIGANGAVLKQYFSRYGAECPKDANPAEFMIDVVSGSLSQGRDWHQVWLDSPESSKIMQEIERIEAETAPKPSTNPDDGREFAAPFLEQVKIVLQRANRALFRNNDYSTNKFMLHISSALFNGFTFFSIGDAVSDTHLRLFTIFSFIFVAPGVIQQLQPRYLQQRDIYEVRERKAKMYSWITFTIALIVSEIPYLMISGILYWVCWYYTVGFPFSSSKTASVIFVMLCYEMIYTGIGQAIAAYAPNAVFAALVNPLIINVLVSFCGVLVPYAQITAFWRYWMYYLDPFNYLMGSLLVFTTWDTPITCKESELAIFDTPNNQTCAAYLSEYLQSSGIGKNLLNPDATRGCQVCQYTRGSDYLKTLNLQDYYFGWRDAGIVALFVFSSYLAVFALMRLRTKQTRKAEK